jgi:hypothetical protein
MGQPDIASGFPGSAHGQQLSAAAHHPIRVSPLLTQCYDRGTPQGTGLFVDQFGLAVSVTCSTCAFVELISDGTSCPTVSTTPSRSLSGRFRLARGMETVFMKFVREVFAAMLSGIVLLATTSNLAAMPMYEPFYQEDQQAALTASDIENIVSPIALYPDQLIAQILGAATYPDQVTAASNWVNSSGLKDQALMEAADKQPWDPSVKALTQFPAVLDQMAKNLAWTSALGDAAFNQQKDVMAAIQKLRQEAKAAGNLKTTKEIKVVQESPQTIVIQPANPQVVYVPTYNPTVVYGTPYQPPGYSTAALVTTGLISFGVGMAIGASMNNSCCGWGWGGGGWGCNWHGGNVMYQNNVYVSRSNTFYGGNRYANNPYYKNNNRATQYNANNRHNNASNNKAAWNSGNRNSGNTVNRGGNTVNINGAVNVGNTGNANRPNQGNTAGNRPGAGNNTASNRPGNANAGNRPGDNSAAANRPSTADRGYGGKPQTSNASAIGGYKQGGNARADANRGKQSMGGGGGGGRQASAPKAGGGRKR